MFGLENYVPQPKHEYYLFSTGTFMKSGYYPTRKDAERAMNKFCNKHGISVECVECDKHERMYVSKLNDIEFYINRV